MFQLRRTLNHSLALAAARSLRELLEFLIRLIRYVVPPAALINPLYIARFEITYVFMRYAPGGPWKYLYNRLFIAAAR